MDTDYAQPGDTIKVTLASSAWLGKRFTVIEPPDKDINYPAGVAWVMTSDQWPAYIPAKYYKIVKRAGSSATNKSNIDIDAKLKQQLNDNLRSIFR